MALEVWPLLLSGFLGIKCLVEIFTRRRRTSRRCSCTCSSCCMPSAKGGRRPRLRAGVPALPQAQQPPQAGMMATVTCSIQKLELEVKAAGLEWPNGPSGPWTRKLGMSGCITTVDLESCTALIDGNVGWCPVKALGGYEDLCIASRRPAATLPLLDANGDAAEPETPMGKLGASCLEAQIRTADGALEDLTMQGVLQMSKAYTQILSLLGSSASMVLWDFEKNLTVVQQTCDKDPQVQYTLNSFLQAELDSGEHTPGPGDKCKLRDPSGACSLQWMIRSFHFFMTMIQLSVVDNVADAADKAYKQTLQPYHGFMSSLGFKAALLGMPSRNDILATKDLCPTLANDATKLAWIISRDCKETTSVVLPTLDFMITSFRRRGLWSGSSV
mmetsp:Transcript_17437/g.31629  ORF Transcript_17437/g.31629 Transcript_17437/m.31629 type:complete len:387 (-) Transcript_17437:11-1171(-)